MTSADHQTEKRNKPQRSSNWNKVGIMGSLLDDYEYILWLDADVFIVNHTMSLDEVFPLSPRKDFYVCVDVSSINMGVFLLRSNQWTETFITRWMDEGFQENDHYSVNFLSGRKINNLEQSAFVNLYERNWNNVMVHTEIIDPVSVTLSIVVPYCRPNARPRQARRRQTYAMPKYLGIA